MRATRLIEMLRQERLTKYNLDGPLPDLPPRGDTKRILVVGQVADDASVQQGAAAGADNDTLLAAARAAEPDAVILYKPHPDVEAGLRAGAIVAGARSATSKAVTVTHP